MSARALLDSMKSVATPGSAAVAPLRILIVALNYAPEIVGCGKYTSELAEDLARRGHRVEVVTAPPYYPDWKIPEGYSGARWSTEPRAGVLVHRTPLYVPGRPSGMRRVVHLASFGLFALPTAVNVARRLRPDLVFAVEPTLAASVAALAAGKAMGARTWLHVQDFEVDAAFDLGVLKNPLGRRLALSLERLLLGGFHQVSAISNAMVKRLLSKGVPQYSVTELRNWVDVSATPVYPSSDTGLRKSLGIPANRIVALYSGNMAGKQGLEMISEVARTFDRRCAPITFVLCGSGPGRANLEAACADLGNVVFLPLQPADRLGELLGSADIHLLPQRPEAADLVLPSKLTGILASGRPVVAMAASGTALSEEVEGCGIAVEASAASMSEALSTLIEDSALRKRYGLAARRRAESRWCKDRIIGEFELQAALLITNASASHAGKTARQAREQS